jgi:hypothetical protein
MDLPVPTYLEYANGAASTSTAAVHEDYEEEEEELAEERVRVDDDYGEEFDGYEEVSITPSTRIPPPTIHADVSPPSHSHTADALSSFDPTIDTPDSTNQTMDATPVSSLSELSLTHVANAGTIPTSAINGFSEVDQYVIVPPVVRLDDPLPPPYIGDIIVVPAVPMVSGPPPYES